MLFFGLKFGRGDIFTIIPRGDVVAAIIRRGDLVSPVVGLSLFGSSGCTKQPLHWMPFHHEFVGASSSSPIVAMSRHRSFEPDQQASTLDFSSVHIFLK